MPKVEQTTKVTYSEEEVVSIIREHVARKHCGRIPNIDVSFEIGGYNGPSYPGDDHDPLHLKSVVVKF